MVLFFVLRGSLKKEKVSGPEINSLKNYIQECLDEQLEYGVIFIGLQGGYDTLPENHLITEFSSIAYGYNKRNTLITLSEMEDQMSYYIGEVLPLCVDETVFPDLTIETRNPRVKTVIERRDVLVEIDYRIIITKGDSVSEIRDFKSKVSVRLGDMHNAAKQIIEELSSNYIDLTYLSGLDYTVNILPQDNNVFIYSIIDEETKLNEVPYVFNFAVRK